jgi:phage regulator Rha-like protein
MPKQIVLSVSLIEKRILLLRGQKVMLSSDLAELYEVQPKALIQAVRRNAQRFPEDFMFQLTPGETNAVQHDVLRSRSQIVTLKRGQNIKYCPYAFTEQGVAMLSSVLKSRRAIQVNIAIVRAFVRLRDILTAHKELAHKLDELERKLESHDVQIRDVFEVIRQLVSADEKPKRRIGFEVDDKP